MLLTTTTPVSNFTVGSPALRFGEDSPDPGKINETNRKTLANAATLPDQYLASRHFMPKPRALAQEKLAKAKSTLHEEFFNKDNGILTKTFLGACGVVTAFAGFSGWGFITNHNYIQTHTADPNFDSTGKELQSASYNEINDAQLFRFLSGGLFLLTGGLFTLGSGVLGFAITKEINDLRKALKESKALEEKIIDLEPPTLNTEKAIATSLEKWITQEAEGFAKTILEVYESEPEAQPQFNAIFGSKQNLPDAKTIRNLFKYYTFIGFQEERPSKGKQTEPGYKVSELDFLKRQYALIKTGNKLGELFQFVSSSEKKDPLFKQSLNKNLLWQAVQTQDALEGRIQTLRELHTNGIEADRHIGLAQQALVSARLSRDEAKAIEIRKLVEDFKAQKEKIQETIAKVDQGFLEDNQILEGLNDNFNHSVSYLQAVMESKKVELAATESIQNLLKKRSTEAHKTTSVV